MKDWAVAAGVAVAFFGLLVIVAVGGIIFVRGIALLVGADLP